MGCISSVPMYYYILYNNNNNGYSNLIYSEIINENENENKNIKINELKINT